MALLKPPYQYVIDSSALYDLRLLYPKRIFSGVWERFNEMCANKLIVAPREVLREIHNGHDDLINWADEYENIFLEPCEDEFYIVQEIVEKFRRNLDVFETRAWADPFVIACAKYHGITIIQHEKLNGNKLKLPFLAGQYGIECIKLVDFFDEESWTFN